jgi:hypothetical protein
MNIAYALHNAAAFAFVAALVALTGSGWWVPLTLALLRRPEVEN